MAIKAQALVDFITEFTYDVAPNPEIEIPQEQDRDGNITKWKLFLDESSNQHGCGVCLVLQNPLKEQMQYVIRIGFNATNNEVEYEALIARLKVASEMEVKSLDAYNDSQLVINQILNS